MVFVSRASPGVVAPFTICIYTNEASTCVETVGPFFSFDVPGRLVDIVIPEQLPLPLVVVLDAEGDHFTHHQRDRWHGRRVRNIMITDRWDEFIRRCHSSDDYSSSSSDE